MSKESYEMVSNGTIPLREQSDDTKYYSYTIKSKDENIHLIDLINAGFDVSSLVQEVYEWKK